MAATTMVHVRLDQDTKARATKTLAAMGLSVSDAVRVFLMRVVAEQQLPFPLKVPNTETRAAMAEADAIANARKAPRDTRSKMRAKPSSVFDANRESVRRIVLAHRARNPRVFGSVARGEDTENSDLDLLVETMDDTSLFDIAAIELELEALLGCPVHVATDGGLKGAMRERVLADATPV